jgi:glycosyltransferase involved in cell wall biosynthesis
MHIRLIAAGSLPHLSGAAIYNRTIAEALRGLGHSVEETDAPAVTDGVALVDGSALARIAESDLGRVVALIHHPASLEVSPPDPVLMGQERALFGAVRRVVTTSEQTAEQVSNVFGVSQGAITAIVPGVADLPRCPRPGGGPGGGPDGVPGGGPGGPTCRILCLGQLVPRKGQDVLLRCLARLFDLDWHLTIAGHPNDPAYADGLVALVEALKIGPRVTFHPEAIGDALEALWQGADLFALTSVYEGYGMVWAEALRRGLPVVATNTGAAPTLITPDSGVVCMPGDLDQLSKALRRLIFDATLRADMAEAAWQVGRTLPSWADQAGKLAGVLA